MGTDGHDYDELGHRFTWVKMTRPDLEGLHLALLDGAASLRPATAEVPGDPNSHATMAIESMTVRGAKLIGRSSPTIIYLNPWLNAIIGGRGTGKSTLVDFFRTTLRRERELDRTDSEEEGSLRSLFDRRMRVPNSRLEEGLLTDNTCIEIVYRKDGERFLVTWSQDGTAQPICRLDGNDLVPEDGDIGERLSPYESTAKSNYSLSPRTRMHC